ncbi:hypothetical protein COV05_02565 [Candidatus Uhrbacteria bacterium CG10_big_fil_rev_8_21_14_0_10_48_16]|uniref:Uncharacterized protein n=1 Tax=Candidatus Uhrbacteria bacterium CG10_big_fil_rev_8_21_14_0_10_48_16 TaxID=1975038 RepID=A0A2M8LHC5_9BACT|nr:MAG: hypothetical protein COV05_02565 [Candidatus Uhrbacteria bacterium CG10_big_fil_rev_8_21_14_0_10_48_16]
MPDSQLTQRDFDTCASTILDHLLEGVEPVRHDDLLTAVDASTVRIGVNVMPTHPREGYTRFPFGETHLVFVAKHAHTPCGGRLILITFLHPNGEAPSRDTAIRLGERCMEEIPHAARRRNASLASAQPIGNGRIAALAVALAQPADA